MEHPAPRSNGMPSQQRSRILDSVFESMAEGVVVVDERGRFVFFNPMAEQILGMGALDGPLTQWPERYGLYLPDEVTPFPPERLPLVRALRGEVPGPTEIFLRNAERPAGMWLLVEAHPLRDEAGTPWGAFAVFSDVTEFRKAQEALRESEEKYRSLYRSTPVMMHSIDRDGRLLSVSDYWLRTLGYEREEVLGRGSVDFLTPESRRYAQECILPEYFKTGECKDVPYQFVKKNGERLEVLLSAIAERDAAGNIVRSLAVLIDVTERKRAEEALVESEKRLRAILDNAPACVFLLDAQERYSFVNRQWESLFRHSRHEVAGRTAYDVFPREIADVFHQGNQAIFRGRAPTEQEVLVPGEDGLHTHLTLKFPLIDSAGEVSALCGISTDITERKWMEVSRHFLAEASRELVTSLDYESTLQRVAELAVPLLADLCVFLVRAEDALLSPVAVADSSPARARCVREFLQLHPPAPLAATGPAEASGEPWGPLEQALREERRWEPLRPLLGGPSLRVPLQVRGRCLGVLLLVRARPHPPYGPADVLLAEELGRRAAFAIDNAQLYRGAQESIRARDEFLSIASHELKTPLTAMRLRVQLMESTLAQRPEGPQLAGKVTGMVKVLGEQLQRLTHLVNHLLDVSLINEGRLELRREEFDLAAVVREVASHFKEQLVKMGCALELEAAGPVTGGWDRLRVEQVLMNLLTNAMKYGAGRPIRVRVGLHAGKARLLVEDQGMGIPREAQARIFERFERAASHNYGGLGLGLFITRRIVEAHGGSIRVESAPGEGARFIVELPRSPHEEAR